MERGIDWGSWTRRSVAFSFARGAHGFALGRRVAVRCALPRTNLSAAESDGTSETCEVATPQGTLHARARDAALSVGVLGMADTALMAAAKSASGGGVGGVCRSKFCSTVATSQYALLFGVLPLHWVGFTAYAAAAALCVARGSVEDGSWSAVLLERLLLSLAAGMATFSVYLMGVMFGILRARCVFCLISFGLSVVLLGSSALACRPLRRNGIASAIATAAVAALVAFGSHSTVAVPDGLSTPAPQATAPAASPMTAPRRAMPLQKLR